MKLKPKTKLPYICRAAEYFIKDRGFKAVVTK